MPSPSILITGCSSGIGHCTALMLKQRGYRVFAAARKAEDLAHLASHGLESILLDVNDSTSIKQGVETVLQLTGGTLDALFNNAGYLQTGAIEDLSRDVNRAQFETNVFGPIELTRLVIPIMRQQGHGRILFNSSILGVVTLPYCGAYNASKYALEGFALTLRQELRGTAIFVSLINPGPILSQLRGHAFEKYEQTIKHQSASVHRSVYEKMEKNYFDPAKREKTRNQGPEAVVKEVIRALENKHPKAHYFVGAPAKSLAILRRILPESALDWVLSKAR